MEGSTRNTAHSKVTDTHSEFAKIAAKKWLLPTNLLLYPTIPHFQTTEENLKTTVESLCQGLPEARIDILKMNISGTTIPTLYAMLHYGYRPGLICLTWNTPPDATVENTLLAGHLQMTGYGLVECVGNNYLYLFHDKNMYEVCSWQSNVNENPLIAKIIETVTLKNTKIE